MILLKTRTALTPNDFKAQLYISAFDDGLVELTRRAEIAWGERAKDCMVVRRGLATRVAIFDRPEGGDDLANGTINMRVRVEPYDTLIMTNITWGGDGIK